MTGKTRKHSKSLVMRYFMRTLAMLQRYCSAKFNQKSVQFQPVSLGNFGGRNPIVVLLLFCLAATATMSAQKYKSLNETEGSDWPLVQGFDGNLYGVSGSGTGTYGDGGSVFRITPAGKLTTIYTFCSQKGCADGQGPNGIILGTDGNFYGTTGFGGANSNIDCSGEQVATCGTVFKITPAGKLTTMYSFCAQSNCDDGSLPGSLLVQGTDGNLYGTTRYGGSGAGCPQNLFGPLGCGVIFKISLSAKFGVFHNFCTSTVGTCYDGTYPWWLTLGKNGNLYGTTNWGGSGAGSSDGCDGHGCGIFYTISYGGALTTLYNFCVATGCPDGSGASSGVTLASNGNFFGTTGGGGANDFGTVFTITPAGVLTTLYSFCAQTNCPDGAYPTAPPIQATDGNFYGSTGSYGANGTGGTLYQMQPSGKLKTFYSFCIDINCDDGTGPSQFFQATNGTLYGTASGGGTTAGGTIFAVTPALTAFVQPVPFIGAVGSKVTILGSSLSSTIAVYFSGTSAEFTVVSNTEVTVTVPTGATSGKITVATSAGTLSSNVVFEVK
jgi:uncharacterized repeat protein (TIGR03803 family)